MIDPTLFLGFLAATLIIVVTPGSTVALACSKAVKFGPSAAWATVCGDAFGTLTQILIAVLGLQALIAIASDVLPSLQVLGGGYILFLGYRSYTELAESERPAVESGRGKGHFWTGYLVCISNPKSIIFFVALFPTFISQELNIPVQAAIYGSVFVTLDAFFIMGYAVLAMRAFRSPRAGAVDVGKVSGAGLMIVGVLLCWSGIQSMG